MGKKGPAVQRADDVPTGEHVLKNIFPNKEFSSPKDGIVELIHLDRYSKRSLT